MAGDGDVFGCKADNFDKQAAINRSANLVLEALIETDGRIFTNGTNTPIAEGKSGVLNQALTKIDNAEAFCTDSQNADINAGTMDSLGRNKRPATILHLMENLSNYGVNSHMSFNFSIPEDRIDRKSLQTLLNRDSWMGYPPGLRPLLIQDAIDNVVPKTSGTSAPFDAKFCDAGYCSVGQAELRKMYLQFLPPL